MGMEMLLGFDYFYCSPRAHRYHRNGCATRPYEEGMSSYSRGYQWHTQHATITNLYHLHCSFSILSGPMHYVYTSHCYLTFALPLFPSPPSVYVALVNTS